MVDKKEEKSAAVDRIMAFAKDLGLDITPIRGKLLEYLYRNKPEHWKALCESCLI